MEVKDHSGKQIGQLNGIWALMLKVNLLMLPIIVGSVIALGSWMVQANIRQDTVDAVTVQRLDAMDKREDQDRVMFIQFENRLDHLTQNTTEIKQLLRVTPSDVLDAIRKHEREGHH